MNKLIILNKLKSISLGIDDLFKKSGKGAIKHHHAVSAVYQSVYSLIESNDINALRNIFGDVVEDQETMGLMRDVLGEFIKEFIAAGTDDQELNKSYNNFKIIDKDGRFPLRIEPTPSASSFCGQVIVTDSFNRDAGLEIGKLVNVTLTINRDDADKLVEVVRKQLDSIGLEVGRLTGTQDTTERHVSLALRIPYTTALSQVVDRINEEIKNITFATAAKLKIVTPTDIRTSESAVELLNDDTSTILQKWQVMIHEAAGKTGNKLPPLHITHGNSPIKPSSMEDIVKLESASPKLTEALSIYGLDLHAATSTYSSQRANRVNMESISSSNSALFGGSKLTNASTVDLSLNHAMQPGK